MKKNQEAVKIKIITGPNEGAVSVLNSGRYSFGKDDSCDLIIHDSSLADHHIDLEISKNNIILFPLGDEVFVNDQLCDKESRSLALFETVTIGNTSFVIGPEHSRWPDLLDFKPDGLKPANDVSTETDDLNDEPLIEQQIEKNTSAFSSNINKTSSDLPENVQSIWSKLKWFIIGLIGLLLMVLIGSKIGFNNSGNEEISLAVSQIETADSILQDTGYSNSLEIAKSPSGKTILKGYLDDNIAFKSLKGRFSKLSESIVFDVKNTDELAKQGQEILHALNFPKVVLTGKKEGHLVASGYVNDLSSWARTKSIIQQDVIGIQSIGDDELKTQEIFIRYLRTVVSQFPLGKWLNIQGGEELINVSGKLSEDEYENWKEIKAGFFHRYGDLIQMNDLVSTKSKIRLKLAIKGVSIGDVSYVLLKDNNKYMIGSMIEGEYKIEAIKPDKIVLSKDNKSFDYFIGKGKSYE